MRFISIAMGAILLMVLAVGCSQQTTQYKEGEKFPEPNPPADFVKERMKLRESAQQPGAGAQQPSQGSHALARLNRATIK
jgi:hypothetical protein